MSVSRSVSYRETSDRQNPSMKSIPTRALK